MAIFQLRQSLNPKLNYDQTFTDPKVTSKEGRPRPVILFWGGLKAKVR